MKRRKFTEDFKRKAVARILNGEKAVNVAIELKIADSMLYTWRKKFKRELKKQAKASKTKAPNRMATAIVLLHHARDAALIEVKENPDRFDDPVYGLAMMALRTLEKRE